MQIKQRVSMLASPSGKGCCGSSGSSTCPPGSPGPVSGGPPPPSGGPPVSGGLPGSGNSATPSSAQQQADGSPAPKAGAGDMDNGSRNGPVFLVAAAVAAVYCAWL